MGWVICCTETRHLLWGSFFETSPKAGLYRGELLGLVALQTMIVAVTQFYKVNMAIGKICCDNISALGNLARLGNASALGLNTWIFTGQFKQSNALSTYVWYTTCTSSPRQSTPMVNADPGATIECDM